MKNIEKLIEVANFLELQNVTDLLNAILTRSLQENTPLILPLVGEFSSGKTTLINALTDSKSLECASKPTTATIYDIHFGKDRNCAFIHNADGTISEVEDISSLKNDKLTDVDVIDIFDTSNKVPSSVVLVDTPGISSPEPRHRQTLINFLPQADAVLLVSDVNQQITRSLTDFAQTMAISRRPMYLVLTQCDTKSKGDVQAAKDYVLNNSVIPLEGIVCVSAVKGDLDELYDLLSKIQHDKSEILNKVNDQRLKDIANEMISHIDVLMSSSNSDKETDEAILDQQNELRRLNSQIRSLSDEISSEVEDIQRKTACNFEDAIFTKLETIVTGKSADYDQDAFNAVQNTSSLLINQYKTQVARCFSEHANRHAGSSSPLKLQGLKELDLSAYSIQGMSYNLDLNALGHEHDGAIALGTKIAAVAAVVAVAAPAIAGVGASAGAAGAGAAGATGAAGAGAAATASSGAITAAEGVALLDTATDVGSMVSNAKHITKIQKLMKFGQNVKSGLDTAEDLNQQYATRTGQDKGFVEGLVGKATDAAWGKPQRRRAISEYIDTTLSPEFKGQLAAFSSSLIANIKTALESEASTMISEMTSSLEAMKEQRSQRKEEFQNYINRLRDYKNEIITI